MSAFSSLQPLFPVVSEAFENRQNKQRVFFLKTNILESFPSAEFLSIKVFLAAFFIHTFITVVSREDFKAKQ